MAEENIENTSLNATAAPSMLHPHSNDNLLKMDTYDTYSTVNLIKKKIMKDLRLSPIAENSSETIAAPASNAAALPHAPNPSNNSTTRAGALFPGQLRMHKNPKNSYLYLAFDTPENRLAALQQLITVPGRKGVPWREAPVVPHDLAVTYKGEGTRKRERGRSAGDGPTRTGSPSSSSSGSSTLASGANGIKVAGFAHLSKAQQLDRKASHCLKVMKRILPANVYGWDTYVKRFDGIRESPQWKGYRNHVHLSFGNTKEGVPGVGFWAGAMVDGFHYIISAITSEDLSESVVAASATDSLLLPDPPSDEVGGHTSQQRKEEEESKRGGEKNGLGNPVEVAKKKEEEWGKREEKEEKSHAVSSTTAVLSPPCCLSSGAEPVVDGEDNENEAAVVVTMHPIAREVAAAVMGVAREFFSPPSSPPMVAETEERTPLDPSSSSPPPLPRRRRALTVFDKRTGEGFWRKLQIRHNTIGEVMVDLEWGAKLVAPEACQEDKALFHDVQQRVVQVLMGAALQHRLAAAFDASASTAAAIASATDGTVDARRHIPSAVLSSSSLPSSSSFPSPRVVSIHYHLHSGITSTPVDAPRHLLAGAPHLIEYVRRAGQPCLSFRIGPTTFFQVNTSALSIMVDEMARLGELDANRTTLLDLCSGVGTLGICLASRVRRVIGIELVEESVRHARENRKRNGLENVVYHCGRVECVLPRVMSGLSAEEKEDVVVILDPPRAGVNSTVLKWVRGVETIRTVIYISCEQKALELNCPFLTKPATKAYRGDAFEVMKGFGVDMFPHTPHIEMIVMLRRSITHSEGMQREHWRVEEKKGEKEEEGVGNEEKEKEEEEDTKAQERSE